MKHSLLTTLLAILATLLASAPCSAQGSRSQQIRVVLDDGADQARIKGDLQWSTASEELAHSASPGEVSVAAGRLKLVLDGKSYTSARFIAHPESGYIQYSGRGFRGHIELFVGQNGNVVVLNVLPLEEYLYGVVPAEMSPSWPFEALKCQAVAARTYALSRILANMERTYDVYGNVSDQAYRGVSGEHETSTRAVDDTAGMVVDYHGEVITAFYSACAGGMTKQGSAPYLRSVATDHPDSPHHGWEVSLSLEELSSIVRSTGADIGPIKDITVEYDASSGHLLSMIVHGANDSKQLLGTTLRKLVGRGRMKSTRCRVFPSGDGSMPVVASSPTSSTAPVRDESVVNVATEVSVASMAGQAEQEEFETLASQGWLKPWVASAGEQRTVKMRSMYAFDGKALMQCNREMHLLSGTGLPSSTVLTPGESGFSPRVDDDPLPDVQVVNARLSRGELSSGFTIRGDGYGHGIGMSQWGARQLAEDGMDFESILRYFYHGVDIVHWDGHPIQPGELPETHTADSSGFYDAFTSVQLD